MSQFTLHAVNAVKQNSCTGLSFVKVQWTKYPRQYVQKGRPVQEIRLLGDWDRLDCRVQSVAVNHLKVNPEHILVLQVHCVEFTSAYIPLKCF